MVLWDSERLWTRTISTKAVGPKYDLSQTVRNGYNLLEIVYTPANFILHFYFDCAYSFSASSTTGFSSTRSRENEVLKAKEEEALVHYTQS